MHLGKLGIITLILYVRTLKVRLYKYHAQAYLASKRQNLASVWVCFGRTRLFLLPCIEELRQWGLSSDVPTQAGLCSAGWRLGSSVALLIACVCCIFIADFWFLPRKETVLRACFPY